MMGIDRHFLSFLKNLGRQVRVTRKKKGGKVADKRGKATEKKSIVNYLSILTMSKRMSSRRLLNAIMGEPPAQSM